MKNYTYQNTLVSKKQLKQLLAWSFTKYGSIKACFLADELKYLGFKYATQAGISISIEDLRVPSIKNSVLQNSNQEILNTEKICLKGKITDVERFQKIIDTWNITSESLKDEVVSYFKKYDPLNSVYIMAFSGARGNLSQVRQLVGMRGLMSDPSGQIMNLPIKKNFREGLTITDYLMSGYGARKGIVDTALKTANSGYLTRRLIDVAQDIIIREKDCLTNHSLLFVTTENNTYSISEKISGRLLNKPVFDKKTNELIAQINTQITPNLIKLFKQRKIQKFYIRSPLTCCLYRSICQKCYGWDLATENLVDMGESVGIIAGQSIGEPGTQLTMRTFHTGGIFTSEASQQLISQFNGTIKFSKVLKITTLRTNRGENVLLTESSGSLSIIPNKKNDKTVQIELPRNTILFVRDNQYVTKNMIIGQLAGNIKQTRTETKHILTNVSGEIFMPRLKSRLNLITRNKLLWILSGQVYQAPINSFLNFYPDYKINKNNFIFRSKLINQYSGFVKIISNKNDLFQKTVEIIKNIYCLTNTNLQKLTFAVNKKKYLLVINKFKYLVDLDDQDSLIKIKKIPNKIFATLVSKNFTVLTGGIPYYNHKINRKNNAYFKHSIFYFKNLQKKYYRTLVWLDEETHQINCDNSLLLIEKETFIRKNREIIPDLFSETSGILKIFEKNNIIHEISIESGIILPIHNVNEIKNVDNQLFYPGEIILKRIKIIQPSFCRVVKINATFQLLIRPLKLYEVPRPKSIKKVFKTDFRKNSIFNVKNNLRYLYDSGKKVKIAKQLEIITKSLDLQLKNSLNKNENIQIEIIVNRKKNCLNFRLLEKLYLNQYIPANLKYTKIQACLITQPNQYINSYSTLGYLEAITNHSLELVKLKSKRKQNKQLFLISNNDCVTIPKNKIKETAKNNLLIENVNITETGKILIDNNKFLTVQKGRPYFFPNCKNDDFIDNTNLKYRLISSKLL